MRDRLDPTVRAVLSRQEDDPLGRALAGLPTIEAQFTVASLAYQVPVAVLVEAFKENVVRLIHNYDYLGHVRGMLAHAQRHMHDALAAAEIPDDWTTSPSVQKIGRELGLTSLRPCRHCGVDKIKPITPKGRRRQYCSNSCRQAAYRFRIANPETIAAANSDRELGMLPCFTGIEKTIHSRARFELIDLIEAGAITAEQVLLKDRKVVNPIAARQIRDRWNPHSPLLRAANAALAHLEDSGADLRAVHLHGQDLDLETTPYFVGFECRYLPAAMDCFIGSKGLAWLEIPRPSLRGPLPALLIRPADRTRLAERRRDERTYFA